MLHVMFWDHALPHEDGSGLPDALQELHCLHWSAHFPIMSHALMPGFTRPFDHWLQVKGTCTRVSVIASA